MINQPFISVIIPVFNTDVLRLAACFDSINSQTYDNLQIIIVDASNDKKTIEFLSKYKFKYTNVKKIKSDKGVSHQRNLGIKNSDFNFVSFVDSDDFLNPEYFEQLIYSLFTNDCDIAFPLIRKTIFEGNTIVKTWDFVHENSMEVLTKFNYFNFSKRNAYVHPIKVYSKGIIDNIWFDESLKYGEDLIFNYDVAKRNPKVVFCDKAIYSYTANKNSNLVKKHLDLSFFKFLKTLIRIYREKDFNKTQKKDVLHFYNQAFCNYFYSVFRALDVKWIFLSLKYRLFYLFHNFSFYNFVYMCFPMILFFIKKCLKKL